MVDNNLTFFTQKLVDYLDMDDRVRVFCKYNPMGDYYNVIIHLINKCKQPYVITFPSEIIDTMTFEYFLIKVQNVLMGVI